MRFAPSTLSVVLATVCFASLFGEYEGFAPSLSFVRTAVGTNNPGRLSCSPPPTGCSCGSASCNCRARQRTRLFADVAEEVAAPEVEASEADEAVPPEVEAMDGIESADEAHNVDRPARESLKKKRAARGKPLSEFEVGATVPATVKTITAYGAFCDFGASSDGLVHISRMSKEFVEDVNSIVSVGDEVEARIVQIDLEKKQVALSLLSAEEESEMQAARSRPQRRERPQQNNRREEGLVLGKLSDAGYDPEKFVTGKVVNAVAFGAFVRVNAADVNPDVEGTFEGLVHISALQAGRTEAVTDVVNVNDDVQVRVKYIGDGKVSLTMVSVEDEQAAAESRRSFSSDDEPEMEGAADWQEQMQALQKDVPAFRNGPVIVDMRK